MGRGRTTTGMSISVLIHLVRTGQMVPSPDTTMITSIDEGLSTSPEEVCQRYLRGEYKLIAQVLTVLDHGKRAKRLVDAALDSCSHIQNLRTAIYDFKLQDGGDRGLNYLLRYFFLIVFAEYLIEREEELAAGDQKRGQAAKSFVDWLGERREITHMIARKELIEFS